MMIWNIFWLFFYNYWKSNKPLTFTTKYYLEISICWPLLGITHTPTGENTLLSGIAFGLTISKVRLGLDMLLYSVEVKPCHRHNMTMTKGDPDKRTPWEQMIHTKDDPERSFPGKKVTLTKDDLNKRWPRQKMTLTKDDLNKRWPQQKRIMTKDDLTKDDFNERWPRQRWLWQKMTSTKAEPRKKWQKMMLTKVALDKNWPWKIT